MNKKIIVSFTAVLAIVMMLTPFALAKSWEPKNNDKFQSYEVIVTPNFANIGAAIADPEYIPSEDNYNKVITSWIEEPMTNYVIIVGGVSYYLGTDFEYSGVATYTAIGAPFAPNPFGITAGSKANHFRVEYMFDFSAVEDGIDGTLKMLAITSSNGEMHIRSLQGTDDLQNVQIQATGAGMAHIGIVSGWPEIPPA